MSTRRMAEAIPMAAEWIGARGVEAVRCASQNALMLYLGTRRWKSRDGSWGDRKAQMCRQTTIGR